MRAAIIHQHGGPEVLRIENLPDPVAQAGEVIVKVHATSLNYHDVFTRNGMPGIRIPMPMIMGIDFAGEIVATSGDVAGWKDGDRVLIDPKDRVLGRHLMGETRHGGFGQLCAVPAHMLIRLPDAVSYEAAACLPVAYGTAHRMMVTIGRVARGERVLILGAAGGVGTGCVQLARLASSEVIACASSDEKLQRLRELGVTHLMNYTHQSVDVWVRDTFGKPSRSGEGAGGVDVVVNYTGGDTWVTSLKCLRRRGRLLTCGATAGFAPAEDLRYIWTYELQIKGSNGWKREDIVALLDLVAAGSLSPVIDEVFALADAPSAFARLENRQAFGKVVVRPWQ